MNVLALMATAAMVTPGHGAAGRAAEVTVEMPGRYFAPADVQVLVGQEVTWRNADHTAHNVTAEDHSFRSERLSNGGEFSFAFTEPGDYPYYCAIHRSMRGVVRVAALGLTGPAAPLAPGDEAAFGVLAPEGTDLVVLERLGEGGFEPVAGATPDAHGRASFRVEVTTPARYRARAGTLTSATVAVEVAPRVTATAKRAGRRVVVRASISPAQPGATVALKRYVRERFAYLPVRTRRSAGGRRVTFKLRTARRAALRVAVTEAPGGWSSAESRLMTVPSQRR